MPSTTVLHLPSTVKSTPWWETTPSVKVYRTVTLSCLLDSEEYLSTPWWESSSRVKSYREAHFDSLVDSAAFENDGYADEGYYSCSEDDEDEYFDSKDSLADQMKAKLCFRSAVELPQQIRGEEMKMEVVKEKEVKQESCTKWSIGVTISSVASFASSFFGRSRAVA